MRLLFMFIICLFLGGCADSISLDSAFLIETVGFWHGFWHGLISPLSFYVSIFSDSTAIYAIYNNGGWYDFGFLIGIGGFTSNTYRVRKMKKRY